MIRNVKKNLGAGTSVEISVRHASKMVKAKQILKSEKTKQELSVTG